MLSKSFCSKDIRKKNHIKQMLSSFLIEQSFPAYNNIKTFNAPIDNTISKQIEKDLNRKLNLFIKDASSNTKSINVVDNMRKTSTEPIPSSDLCTHLQETYRLSLGQANYIVISSTQGGIGGCYPSDLINNINPDITYMVNRKTLLSQIIIHQNKNVEYIGGQVILFDVSIKDHEQELLQENGIENHLMKHSKDKVVLYVSVNLGTIGQNFTTHPEVHIHVGVVGKYGAEFLAQLNTAKTRCEELKNITYDDIEINYLAFSEDTLYNETQRVQRYNSLVSNVDNPKHVDPEDLDQMLTICAINVPNKQMVELMLKQGSNPNCLDQDGNNLLHLIALENGNCAVAKLLLVNGTNPNITNKDGNTPLEIAISHNHDELIKLLREESTIASNITSSDTLSITTEDYDNYIFNRFDNISLYSIPLTDNLKEANTNSAVPKKPKKQSSVNKFFKEKLLGFQNPTTIIDNNDMNSSTFYVEEEQDSVQIILLNLYNIVERMLSCTVTDKDILELKRTFTYINIKKKQDQFIIKLDEALNNKQLHQLNTVIMQSMHNLLPQEDKICLLRENENKIFQDLLLLEAKRHNMIVHLPKSNNDKLVAPQIPDMIFNLYETLKETFYNQENRQSDKPLDQRIAESIHWLFVNPLILEQSALALDPTVQQMLKCPGEYTHLLCNNILDKINEGNKVSIPPASQELNKYVNDILQIYMGELSNVIVNNILSKTKIKSSKLIKDSIREIISKHFQMHNNIHSLLVHEELISDLVSKYITTLYDSNPTSKHALLSMFLYSVISKIYLENKIASQDNHEVTHDFTGIDRECDEKTSVDSVKLHYAEQGLNQDNHMSANADDTLSCSVFTQCIAILEERMLYINRIIENFSQDSHIAITKKFDQAFMQHLSFYYKTLLGSTTIDNLIELYSDLGEEKYSRILEDIQSYCVKLGNEKLVDWLIQYEDFDPVMLLNYAIYYYYESLVSNQVSEALQITPIINNILTNIDKYWITQDEVMEQRNAIMEYSNVVIRNQILDYFDHTIINNNDYDMNIGDNNVLILGSVQVIV